MANFCPNCGTPLGPDLKFCPECGTPLEAAPAAQPAQQPAQQPVQPAPAAAQQPAPEAPKKRAPRKTAQPAQQAQYAVPVGFSNRVTSPEFAAAVKANRHSNIGCALIFVFLPVVVLTLYGLFSDEIELFWGFFIGACITAFFLLIFFIVRFVGGSKKPWTGKVVGKEQRQVRRRKNDHSGPDPHSNWVPEDIVIIQREDGRTHKIRENGYEATAYHYFKVGDVVHFHAGMGLLFPYEKYDKSHDKEIVCAFCKRFVSIYDDNCSHCGKPLLK